MDEQAYNERLAEAVLTEKIDGFILAEMKAVLAGVAQPRIWHIKQGTFKPIAWDDADSSR